MVERREKRLFAYRFTTFAAKNSSVSFLTHAAHEEFAECPRSIYLLCDPCVLSVKYFKSEHFPAKNLCSNTS
jgi:hypothetical protein